MKLKLNDVGKDAGGAKDNTYFHFHRRAFSVFTAQDEKIDLPATTSLRLWVYDEMRYGLHPLTPRYLNGYLYGALE